MSNTFADLAKKAGQSALRIVPERGMSARNGTHLDMSARAAGDRFYHCAKEIAKILYTKIDARYPDRMTDPKQARLHKIKFDEARNILNEARNQIFEAVLPLFQVTRRVDLKEPLREADEHAHDYFVKNVFYVMTRSYVDWTDELVAPEEVETVKKTITNVSITQSEKLARELLNYSFQFRPVVAPPRR